jgi:hypothetical protein
MPAHRFAFSIDKVMALPGPGRTRAGAGAQLSRMAPRTLITAIHRVRSFE